MKSTQEERRHFNRVDFHAHAELFQGQQMWKANVVDISLRGLLIDIEKNDNRLDQYRPLRGVVYLNEDISIQMILKLAHCTGKRLGFCCESVDIDSISHLRRLIELNTGDPGASERELSELTGQS